METTPNAAGSSPAPTPAPAAPATPPAPAAPVAAPAPATPEVSKPTAAEVMAALKPDERRAFASGRMTLEQIAAARPKTPAATPPATPAEPAAEPVATEPAAAAPETPAEPAAAPATPPTEGELPDRFRFKDPADQAIALIAKSKNVSLLEAGRIYEAQNTGQTPAAAPAAEPAPTVDPELQADDTQRSDRNKEITKLSDERKKAREDVENEKADSLSDQIADKRAELKLLENERKGHIRNREAATAQSAAQQVTASRDRALETYPELKNEGSMSRLALDAYVNRALADPKRAAEFNDPTWPEKLTAEFAQKHNLKKAGSASPTPAPAAPAAVTPPVKSPTPTPSPSLRPKPMQVPGAKLNTGADGVQPSNPAAPTVEDLKAALPRMTPAQRRQVLFARPAAR